MISRKIDVGSAWLRRRWVQRLLTSKIVPAKRAHRFIEAAVGAL